MYTDIWLSWRKWKGSDSSPPLLEEGGWLDQPYMLTWAMEVLEDALREEESLKQQQQDNLKNHAALLARLKA